MAFTTGGKSAILNIEADFGREKMIKGDRNKKKKIIKLLYGSQLKGARTERNAFE